MSLPYSEMDAITDDYFKLDNGKAVDIFFNDSFMLKNLLQDKAGLWDRPSGGMNIRVILEYDGQVAGFYSKGKTLNSDDRESLTAALFPWKHAYGNATVYRIDLLKNNGRQAHIELMANRLDGAQKSIRKLLASSIYDLPGGDSERLTGIRACCNTDDTIAYGGIKESELVGSDGSKNWKGRVTTTVEGISLNVIRTMATTSKLRDGAGGKIDLVTMQEDLFNIIVDRLVAQQRFIKAEDTAKVGFTGVEFEGKTITPDDYCPSGEAIGFNRNHIGFFVHQEGFFERTPWAKLEGSAEDRTMKIFFDGNLVVNNRKAHIRHTNLS